MTKEIDKESRIIMGELNRASVHALYMLVSVLYQLDAGLDGGFVEDGIKYPAIEAGSKAQKKRLKEQVRKVRKHAWECLKEQGFKPGANIANGLYKTINDKIFILNSMASKVFPGKDVYVEQLTTQMKLIYLVLEELRRWERHWTNNWLWTIKSLDKLVRITLKPELEPKVHEIYTPNIRKLMLGIAVLEEYEPEWK